MFRNDLMGDGILGHCVQMIRLILILVYKAHDIINKIFNVILNIAIALYSDPRCVAYFSQSHTCVGYIFSIFSCTAHSVIVPLGIFVSFAEA